MTTFGTVHVLTDDKWLIDAQPHVMAKARLLFKSGFNSGRPGTHTHSPMYIRHGADSAKDLLWFVERYPLEIADDCRNSLEAFAKEYDRRVLAAATADQNTQLILSPGALEPAYDLYEYQASFRNFALAVRRTLLADPVAAGKTESALSTLFDPESRPAVIVCQPHLCRQWKKRVEDFLPDASVEIIRTGVGDLPKAEILILGYTLLCRVEDKLVSLGHRTAIFDEIQELRHVDTQKRRVARALSLRADVAIGASATPIYNLGNEIWSVLDVLAPDALGERASFVSEWGGYDGLIQNPLALGTYLRSIGLMIRRDIKSKNRVSRDVITIDGNLEALKKLEDVSRLLARSVLSNRVGESDASARELDWKLRHATGCAKAKSVAEFTCNLLDNGPVLLAGWHRDVYDDWRSHFFAKKIPYGMITGTESATEKEKSKQDFLDGKTKVLILSLRSGAGIDGLQKVCNQVVFGELDWSPHVHDQIVGRLDRPGQQNPIQAYYLTVEDGSDPFIINLLGVKRRQHDTIVENREADAEIIADASLGLNRVREMARSVLSKLGEAVEEDVPHVGLFGEACSLLQRTKVSYTSEAEQQDGLERILSTLADCDVSREHKLNTRSRIDFLLTRGVERVGVECKINQQAKSAVYRQVRRYAEDGVESIIVFAPWSGVSNFTIDASQVVVIDPSRHQL